MPDVTFGLSGAPPLTEGTPAAEPEAARQAQLRAVPLARLLAYGLAPADATLLRDQVSAGASWPGTGLAIAQAHLVAHDTALAAGFPASARDHLLAASVTASAAQLVMSGDSEERRRIYRVSVDARDAWLRSGSGARRLAVAGAGEEISVIRLDPPGDEPVPVVAVWGGTSGWGILYRRCAQALLDAGLGVALVELPGQGEPRLLHGRPLGPGFLDVIGALAAALARDHRSTGAVGVWGQSFGGLLAGHAAARVRIQACCVTSAPISPEALVRRYPRQRELWADMIGGTGELEPRLRALRFDPERQRIRCPLLVIHGGRDPLVGPDEPAGFVRAGRADSRLVVWADAEHCVYSRAPERDVLVAEWFRTVLAGSRLASPP